MRLIYRITTFCCWCDDNESKLSVSIIDRIDTLAGCLCRFFLCKWLIICCWRPINDKWHENNYRIIATTSTSLMPARQIESSNLVKYESFYSCVAVWCKQITSIYYFGNFHTINSNRFILLHQLDMAVMQRHKNLKKNQLLSKIKLRLYCAWNGIDHKKMNCTGLIRIDDYCITIYTYNVFVSKLTLFKTNRSIKFLISKS